MIVQRLEDMAIAAQFFRVHAPGHYQCHRPIFTIGRQDRFFVATGDPIATFTAMGFPGWCDFTSAVCSVGTPPTGCSNLLSSSRQQRQ